MKNAWETDPAIIHLGTSYLLSSPDHLLIATYHFEGDREKETKSTWALTFSPLNSPPLFLKGNLERWCKQGNPWSWQVAELGEAIIDCSHPHSKKIPPSVPAVMCESFFKWDNVEDSSWWEVRRRRIDCNLDCKCKFSSFATFCLKPWSLCKAACKHIKISEISPSFPLQCRLGSKITSTS